MEIKKEIFMKEIKELKFEELTLEQKLGMVTVASIRTQEDFEYTLELVKKRAIGAVWILPYQDYKRGESQRILKEAADYPLLFLADAESGMGSHLIGRQNAIGMTGSEELAYTFGKITAIEARRYGVNVVGNPILDMVSANAVCAATVRSIGGDKEKVAKLAAAIARGMHDGGVLTIGKHFPGKSPATAHLDEHMVETWSDATVDELLEYNLYPYKYLIERDLLDGIMVEHTRFTKVDNDYPASLSKPVLDIARDKLNYKGFFVTDALEMFGIKTKFGQVRSRGLALSAGNELILGWYGAKHDYEALAECYKNGEITDEQLDRAVKVVLETQHKTMMLPEIPEITEEDEKNFARINKDSIYQRADEGIPLSVDKNSKPLFVIVTSMETRNDAGKLSMDTMTLHWYKPEKIAARLEKEYPGCTVHAIKEYPTGGDIERVQSLVMDFDNVVLITYFNSSAGIGRERFTPRLVSLIEALQVTNEINTLLYFGNPFVLEEIPHVDRLIIDPTSEMSVEAGLDVLAGDYPAKGVMTYDVKLN